MTNATQNEMVSTTQIERTPSSLAQSPQIVQNADGKFKRQAAYHAISTVKVETREDKIKLVNILNGSDDTVQECKRNVGVKIKLKDLVTNPYESVDEDTGEITNGVTTMMFDEDGDVYVTSSKSVYFTLQNLFKVFAMPSTPDYETLELEIIEKQGQRFKYIDVKLVG